MPAALIRRYSAAAAWGPTQQQSTQHGCCVCHACRTPWAYGSACLSRGGPLQAWRGAVQHDASAVRPQALWELAECRAVLDCLLIVILIIIIQEDVVRDVKEVQASLEDSWHACWSGQAGDCCQTWHTPVKRSLMEGSEELPQSMVWWSMTVLLQYLAETFSDSGANLQGSSSRCRQTVQAPLVAASETRRALARLFEAFEARKSVKSAKCEEDTSHVSANLIGLPLGRSIIAYECRTFASDVLHCNSGAMSWQS